MLKSKRTLKPKAKAKGNHLPKPAALAGKERNTKNSKLSKQKTQLKPNSIWQSRGTKTSNRTGYGGGVQSSDAGDAELQKHCTARGGGNLAGN